MRFLLYHGLLVKLLPARSKHKSRMATDSADRVWFTLDTASKPVGPYTVQEIVGWAAAGYVSEAQLFWKEGNAAWTKAAEIPELADVHKAVQAFQQQHPGHHAVSGSHPHPHVKVIAAKPSDPLDAFKHEIQAVEQAGTAADADADGGDAATAATTTDDGGGLDGRGGTPEELEFEDDDGTIYVWDRQLRKYVPAGEEGAAVAAGSNSAAAGAAAATKGDGYDIEAMTFVAEEEVIPTLAAAKAAEEAVAAGSGKGKKRAGEGVEGQAGKKPKLSEGAAAADTEAPEAAAENGAAAAAAAAGAAAQKGEEQQQPPGWFELKKNTSVYVTGLPDDTDADEVAGVFAKCGIVKLDDAGQPRIKLYRDKASGMLKGDGLVTYLKAPSVELACQILDGTPLRGTGANMSVTPAKFEMKGQQYQDKKGPPAAAKAAKPKSGGGGRGGRGGGSKGGRDRGRRGALGVQEKLERKLGWGGFDDLLPPEKVTVVLKRLFTPDEAAEGGNAFVSEMEADVTAECKKLGMIQKVRVFAQHPEGVVTVRFKQAEPAEACVSLMDGRFFGGNKLVAHMWDGFTQYHGVKAEKTETAEEQEARLEAFARELEAKQQQKEQQLEEQEQQQQQLAEQEAAEAAAD